MNQLETWGILMKADSPLASKDYLEASDLINIPLINTARMKHKIS